MITCQERSDETPICPHCGAPLTSVSCQRLSSTLGKRYIYYCPGCKKALGVSHRKGFWMG
jgi:uncharacterized protein with PIN domain